MKNYIDTFFTVILLLVLSLKGTVLKAQGYCISGCNSNAYVNSSDPNTIEYDNMISVFHASIAKEKDGTFKVWGQGSASTGTADLLSPTILAPSSGFNYVGTPLKAAAGSHVNTSNVISHQFAILTTDGLYVWGGVNTLISNTIKSTAAFGKISVNGKTDGLPAGVSPTDVKMMFGSYLTLAIVTCSGDAWVLSGNGAKNGDGTTEDATNNLIWHRVKTAATGNPNLTNVVAMRGTPNALFALTSTGKLYTWGTLTYDNNNAATTRVYATEISVPAGASPKMIGMTQNVTGQTYYLLAKNGKLYSMGDNSNKQIGDGTTTARTVWVQPKKITDQNGQGIGVLENITWISPNEHSNFASSAAINVLTTNNKQWAWGANSGNMLGTTTTGAIDPLYMPGQSTNTNGLNLTDEVIAVETGGHTTINVKKCSQNYGYVGHRTNGSMGDGTAATGNPNTYSYSTAILIVCGTDLGPKIQNLKICPNQTANLNNAIQEANPNEVEWHATNDASSPIITNVSTLGPGTYYAFFSAASGKCRIVGSIVTVSYYTPGDQGVNSCACFNDAATGGTNHDTKVGITLLKRAGGMSSDWPMVRKSGHIALESNTKGFVVTRLSTVQLDAIKNAGNAVEGMMSYDTTANCIKIYSGGDWKCFNMPSCP